MIRNLAVILAACFLSACGREIRQLQTWLGGEPGARPTLHSQRFARSALDKGEANRVADILLEDAGKQLRAALEQGWKQKMLIHDNDTLRFEYRIFGDKPKGGRSLFISMHGGGNTAPRVNDQQWRNQVTLYTPAEGVYLAPRAPTNTWNLWHESHIDTLFANLIHAAVLFENVDRNKVYLMGYSAGGDGVYQLAPRMADYLAAAAMMAGHPNETSPLGLRNIGFTIHMGALDNGFNRNDVAKRWAVWLDSLAKIDTGGYRHVVQLHEGRPHWMNREDSVAIPWIAAFRRNPIPQKVVWKQDDVLHTDFYWLAVPARSARIGAEVIASYRGNEVIIHKNDSDTLLIRVNDAMMDLDKPVTVRYKNEVILTGKLSRTIENIYRTVDARKDPGLVFPAEIVIADGKVVQF